MTLTRRKFLLAAGAVTGGAAIAAVDVFGLPGSRAGASGLPDMVVTSVSGVSGITAGDIVYFSATMQNVGSASTPPGTVNAVAFRVDGTEVSWSGTDTAALAAGASITVRADRGGMAQNGSWTATQGSHTLTAVANDVHRFPESNTANNGLSVKFTVASGKPVNTAVPTITGTPQVGNTLTVSSGTWS